MSGDVQPRKRKDKKRKKDDLADPEPPIIPSAAPVSHVQHDAEDFNIIHVHSDHGTGGGICAKLIFFILLFVLAGLTGLIVYQNQGVENYDTPIAESRFANIFEGWTDEPAHDHDSHDDHAALDALDDHEEEHDEAPDHDDAHDEDEHDEEHDEEHEEGTDEQQEESETQLSEEPADEEDEPNISEPDANDDADDEDDDHVSDELDNELENDVIDENTSQNDDNASQNDDNASQNDDDNASQNDDDASQNDDDNASQNDDDDNASQNDDDNVSQNDDDNASQNDDDNASQIDDADDLKVESQETDQNDDDDEDDDEVEARNEDISSENEIFEEESVETNAELNVIDEPEEEEIVDNTQGEDELVKQSEEAEPEVEEPRSDVAVKIGVGVALAVVAYTVLVKKWKSGKPDKAQDEDMYIDLSRRNTITCDPTLENFETDSNDIEDEYSDEEDDEEEEEEDEEIEDIIMKKINYEKIQSSYSRLLPPEEDTLIVDSKIDDYDEEDKEEENVEYDDEEGEEYEEEAQEDNEHGDEEHEEYQDEDEEDEEGEEDQEEISDVDDEDLMKKLEAKYGKLQDSKGEEEDEEEDEDEDDYYAFKRTANPKQDKKDETDRQMKFAEANLQNNAELALKLYTNLLATLPNNIQIKYGHALALDNLADSQRSNKLLQDAIQSYEELLQTSDVPDDMFLQVGDRCINRLRFRGYYDKAVQIHKQLISRFPKEPNHRNQLAVTLLTANRLSEAKQVLRELLLRWPNDGFAKVNYGFILKTRDNNLTGAIEYLKSGIESKAEGVVDGRFYFHLGDALTRLRRNDEAQQIFEDGVNHNVFLSKYQRSLYNVERLTARPWWYAHQTPYQLFFNLLEEKWQQIRDEGLALLSKTGFFKDEAENLKDTGQWKQFELFARGQKMVKNCQKCPLTCKIVETCPDAWNCRRGQIKFSVMHPGTHVWPHCGPSNCRLRSHLGLKVPPNTFIRVADKIRSWSEGKVFIFDDSFEHEVWHNGSDIRLVLIVDVWHPELTNREKHLLPAI